MGSAVERYRHPETTGDVAEVVKVFLQADFGMDVHLREAEGPGPSYYIHADLHHEGSECGVALVMVGDDGFPYVLDEEEMEAVEAMRKDTPPDRSKVMKLNAAEVALVVEHRDREKTKALEALIQAAATRGEIVDPMLRHVATRRAAKGGA